MSKTTNKFSPEVRARAVRMILDHEGDYPSRWSAVVSVADKIGCAPQTLHEWVKKAEVDSGKRAGGRPILLSGSMCWGARTASCGKPTRYCAKHRYILRRRSEPKLFGPRSTDDRVYR